MSMDGVQEQSPIAIEASSTGDQAAERASTTNSALEAFISSSQADISLGAAVESPVMAERRRSVSSSSSSARSSKGDHGEEEVTYDHFEDRLRLILNDGGFVGGVDDYYVFDTSFRKRQSLIGSSGLNSEKLDDLTVDNPAPRPRRMSTGVGLPSSSDGEDSYVEFFVELKSGTDISLFLLRRFSDFENFEANLRRALKVEGIRTPIPGLPAKQVFAFGGRWKEKGFVEQRRQLLDAWIKAVLLMQSKGGAEVKKAFIIFMSG